MGKDETKLYYYLSGALICLMLLMRRFLNAYQAFTTVVFCSLTMFLLLVALFYFGITKTAGRGIKRRPWSLLALLGSAVYLFVLMIPLGLFGFSNYIKFSVPISGSQFTWITVNRYPIAITAIVVYFVMAFIGIYFSAFARDVIQADGDHPFQVFKKTARLVTLKHYGYKIFIVIAMLVGVCLFIIGLGWVNQHVENTALFLLSQGLIDILAPFAEILIVSRLLAVKFQKLSGTYLLALYGVALVLFAALSAGITQAQLLPSFSKPTIIVHRGVINHNAQGNTIAALKQNSRYHFPFVEMDIQETRDHHFICAHNDDLRIPGDGLKEIDQLSLKTIKKYHHVDMFSDYLKTANRLKQPLIIELKVTNNSDRHMGTRFADQFKAGLTVLPHRVHSVGYPFLRQIKHRIPSIHIGLVTMLNFGNIREYNVDFYTLQHLTANPFLIASVGATGRPVYSWTDDSRLSMVRMEMLGTSGQVTDQAFRLSNLHVNYQRDRWILLLNSLQNYL